LLKGILDSSNWKTYLSCNLSKGSLLNNGFREFRTTVGGINVGESWAVTFEAYNEDGTKIPFDYFNPDIQEIEYDDTTGSFFNMENPAIVFNQVKPYFKELEDGQ
jgi:hypothetical protein